MQRFGMTVPFDGQQLHEQRDRFERLERLGYTDLWTAEAMGADGLTPLTLGAVWTPSMRLGTAILPAYTRGPALLAQSVAGLASAAPGRFVLGIGSSSNVIVERWNGIPFEKPFQQTRDMVRFLKAALGGEKALAEKYSCPAALLATPAVAYIIDKAAASEASELIEAAQGEAPSAEAPSARGARKRKSR